MSKKEYPIVGTKSSILWDEDTDAWVYISGEPERTNIPKAYYSLIPTLYRGVDLRASSISSLPWAIYEGDKEYDTSDNYQNRAGLVKNMTAMLYLIEASLVMAGCSYWKREKNPAGYDKLRHLDPTSMSLNVEAGRRGELVWERYENTVKKEYTTKEIIYLWYPDPFVEIGPPSSYPAKTALNACGVLANLDEFARNYFGRGAIKAMLFSMSGASKSDAEKFESWWNKFIAGISNAFRTKVVNAEKVTPIVVGEGIKELENLTLSQEKREEIAIALSIPMSILFANAANYATAERDKLNWYEDKIVPEANLIASFLNDQVFTPLGLHFEFLPESLDIFQEDEAARAAAMSQFMDALDKAGSLEMAQALFLIYGVEVSDEAMELIKAHFAGKQERADAMAEQLSGQNSADENTEDEPADQEEPAEEEPMPPEKKVDPQQLQRELSLWQSKCLKALDKGNAPASVAFVPVYIQPLNYERICAGLAEAKDVDAVKAAFAAGMREPEPEPIAIDPMLGIWQELKRANDLLERTE